MPGYIIVDITIRDPEIYERYRVLAGPTVAAYGGRYLVRGGETEILEGKRKPQRCVILEFPSVAAGRAWWDSPEYAPAKALRQSCAATEMLLVEGMLPVPA